MLKHGSKVVFEGGTTGQRKQWNPDEELFKRWKEGTTGMPLVDANMRELNATGGLLISISFRFFTPFFEPLSIHACNIIKFFI